MSSQVHAMTQDSYQMTHKAVESACGNFSAQQLYCFNVHIIGLTFFLSYSDSPRPWTIDKFSQEKQSVKACTYFSSTAH